MFKKYFKKKEVMIMRYSISFMVLIVMLFSCFSCSNSENDRISQNGIANLKKIKMSIDWVPSAEYYGIFYAKEYGIYKKKGYDVEIQYGSGAPSIAAQIATGAIYIGTTTSDNILRQVARGANFKKIFPLMAFNPSSIVSLEKKPVKSPVDLEGITLGVNVQSSVYQQFQYLIDNKIIKSKSFKEFPIGYGGAPQLLNSQVDAFLAYTTNQAVDLELKNTPIHELYFGNLGISTYGLVLAFAEDKYLKQAGINEQDVDHIAEAILEGYQSGGNDIEHSAIALLNAEPTLNRDKIKLAIKKIGVMNRHTAFPPKSIDIWVQDEGITEEIREKTLNLYKK